MTDNNHPITPSPELVIKWLDSTRSHDCIGAYPPDVDLLLATAAARWGSDQELEACCGWIESQSELGKRSFTTEARVKFRCEVSDRLRAARRLKPPSLKEQALEALEAEDDAVPLRSLERGERFALIRRALESLPS